MKREILVLLLGYSVSLLYAGGKFIPIEEPKPEYNSDSCNVALKIGTLGVGGDISKMVNDKVGVRFNVNGLNYNKSVTVSNINYDATLKLFTAGLLTDYYPMDNSNFRLSMGLYYNNNHAIGDAYYNSPIRVGNYLYDAKELGVLNAKAYYKNKMAPYLGIGWGSRGDSSDWGLSLDIGLLYQGNPKADVNLKLNEEFSIYNTDELKNYVQKSVERDIEDKMKNYHWYPVIMIGVNHSF